MEKVLKTIKIISITLMVILLSIIAFCGVFSKQNNIWKNVIPEFNYGIELEGLRELRYTLDTTEEEKNVYIDSEGNILGEIKEKEETETETSTGGISLDVAEEPVEEATEGTAEEPTTEENKDETEDNKPNYATELRTIKANEDSVKTIDNFEKTKSIIQKRLENEDVYEYNTRLDNLTGDLIVEVPDDDESLNVTHSAVTTIGKFEIIDEQTGMILLDRDDITKTESGLNQDDSGYQAYLKVYFNKEGTQKLKDISNEYIEVVDDAGESTIYYVSVLLDGQTLVTTYFGEELANGALLVPIGNPTTDANEMNEILKEVRRIADVINEEKLPIAYTLSSDNFIESEIKDEEIQVALIVFAVAIVIASIVLIIKFRTKGLVASILAIGYIAILNIIARYASIYVTFNSIIAFIGVIVLNYVFIKLLLLELKKTQNRKEAFLKTMKIYYLSIVPVCIIAIVFTFMSNVIISSIGMILFWGLFIQVLYNAFTILTLGLI